MRLRRKIPAIIGMALIACGLVIVIVHLEWPGGYEEILGRWMPWTLQTGMKLPTIVLTIGVILMLVASTGSRDLD